jgi:hypothetical protein
MTIVKPGRAATASSGATIAFCAGSSEIIGSNGNNCRNLASPFAFACSRAADNEIGLSLAARLCCENPGEAFLADFGVPLCGNKKLPFARRVINNFCCGESASAGKGERSSLLSSAVPLPLDNKFEGVADCCAGSVKQI